MSTINKRVGEVGDYCLDPAVRGWWNSVIRRYNERDAKRRMIEVHRTNIPTGTGGNAKISLYRPIATTR
jgi:hypothetical protein